MSLKTPYSQEACGCLGSGQMCLQADPGVHTGAHAGLSVEGLWQVPLRALCSGQAQDCTATRTPALPLTSAATPGKRPIVSEPRFPHLQAGE